MSGHFKHCHALEGSWCTCGAGLVATTAGEPVIPPAPKGHLVSELTPNDPQGVLNRLIRAYNEHHKRLLDDGFPDPDLAIDQHGRPILLDALTAIVNLSAALRNVPPPADPDLDEIWGAA